MYLISGKTSSGFVDDMHILKWSQGSSKGNSIEILLKFKKSLKIPKGLSEAVNQRRTDNTMAKRTNNDLQNTTQKTRD